MSGPHATVRKDRSAPDIESGVVVSSNRLWGFEYVDWEYPIPFTDAMPVGDGSVPLVYTFLDGTEELKNLVRSAIHKDERPSPDFETWEDYANIRFIETKCKEAPIRITFDPNRCQNGEPKNSGLWSKIGSDALHQSDLNGPSMCLSGLQSWDPKKKSFSSRDVSPKAYRGAILHEFGHALGLQHEHQGPAAQQVLQLDRSEVLKDPMYCDEAMHAWADLNIISKLEMKDIMNYTKFDKDSIMIYTIPMEWRGGPYKGKIVQNVKLSKLDKAFIQLIYPPKLDRQGVRDEKAEKKFRQAIVDAGVPDNFAVEIFLAYERGGRTLRERLMSVRDCFDRLKVRAWTLWNSKRNYAVAQAIDPASFTQFGVNGFLDNIAENRLFQSVVKNVVHRTMEQHGILTKVSLPGNTQHQMTRMLAAFAAQDEFGRHVNQYVSQLVDTSASPPISRPRDDNSVAEPPSTQPESQHRTPFDLHESAIDWAQNTKGLPHATAHVTKAKQENTVTIRVDPDDEQATLRSAENSSEFSKQAVDVDGSLYYEHTDRIKSGTMATWSPRGIVFHKDGGFTACFLPSPFLASASPLPDENKLFENVEWKGL